MPSNKRQADIWTFSAICRPLLSTLAEIEMLNGLFGPPDKNKKTINKRVDELEPIRKSNQFYKIKQINWIYSETVCNAQS